MFLVVETGKVSEVLLEDREGKINQKTDLKHPKHDAIKLFHIYNPDLLLQVEH